MLEIVRTNSDNPDFHQLTKELDVTLCDLYGTKQEDFEEYNRIVDLETVVLAYVDKKPVGCGCFKKFNTDSIEIKRMFVQPEQRGKGVASRILYELESWAFELKYSYAALETGNKQEAAISLYQNLGYTITNKYGQYADNDISVCMLKSLWPDT
jgi:GNAT superfamily N-acetyltransferase